MSSQQSHQQESRVLCQIHHHRHFQSQGKSLGAPPPLIVHVRFDGKVCLGNFVQLTISQLDTDIDHYKLLQPDAIGSAIASAAR